MKSIFKKYNKSFFLILIILILMAFSTVNKIEYKNKDYFHNNPTLENDIEINYPKSSNFDYPNEAILNHSDNEEFIDLETDVLIENGREEIIIIANLWNGTENKTGLLMVMDYNFQNDPVVLDSLSITNSTGSVEFMDLNIYDIDQDNTKEILVTGAINQKGWSFLRVYNYSRGKLELEIIEWWFDSFSDSLRLNYNDLIFGDFDADGFKEICIITNVIKSWEDHQNTFRFWNLIEGEMILEYNTHFNPTTLNLDYEMDDNVRAINIDSDDHLEIVLSCPRDTQATDFTRLYALNYTGTSLNLESEISYSYAWGPKKNSLIFGDFDADGVVEYLDVYSYRDGTGYWHIRYNMINYSNNQFDEEFHGIYQNAGFNHFHPGTWLGANFDLDNKTEFISSEYISETKNAYLRYWENDGTSLSSSIKETISTNCEFDAPSLRFLKDNFNDYSYIIIGFSELDIGGSSIALKIVKKSTIWNLTGTPIIINGNAEFTSLATDQPWCSGLGTSKAPYIIKNVVIGGQDCNACLEIKNVDIHFQIRNCTFFEAKNGINLDNASNGKITNNRVENNTENGIYLCNSTNNIIMENNCSGNKDGIKVEMCQNNNITENICFSNQDSGIRLITSRDNTIRENNCSNNLDGICLRSSSINNTLVKNIALLNLKHGITLNETSYENMILNNIITLNQEFGIYLRFSNNNTLLDNYCSNNSMGIIVYASDNNTISNNNCSNNSKGAKRGIDFHYSNNNVLENNYCSNQKYGINLAYSDQNKVNHNYCSLNTDFGISIAEADENEINKNICWNNDAGIGFDPVFMGGTKNIISENELSRNWDGIYAFACQENTFTENLIYLNEHRGLFFTVSTENNLIYKNYIFNNSINGEDLSFSYNDWDNGTLGNYWGDYLGIDINEDGIGDTPYDISGSANRKDNYPIMNYNPFFLSNPKDLTYEIGETGNMIKWVIINTKPQLQLTYNLYLDGISIRTGKFFSHIKEIIINVDGLDLGTYGYTLEVQDENSGTRTDGVEVKVINKGPIFTYIPDDLIYEIGSNKNWLSWNFSDETVMNPTFSITRNGIPIFYDEPCESGYINISVGSLSTGVYSFLLTIEDGYGESISDTVLVEVMNTAPIFLDKPSDLSFEIGTIDHNLTWRFSDISTLNSTYSLTRDGIPILYDVACEPEEFINISVGSLWTGIYSFLLTIEDGYGESISDTVLVEVMNTAPIFLDKPSDLSFEIGTIDHNLTWRFSDISTLNACFSFMLNSEYMIINEQCNSGKLINISILELDVGIHSYMLEINDGYGCHCSDNNKITITNSPPQITSSSSDLNYEEGEKGQEIFWIFNDISIKNATYTILKNGVEISKDIPCTSNEEIRISVDDLSEGTYYYSIEINDGYGKMVADIITVSVHSSTKESEEKIKDDSALILGIFILAGFISASLIIGFFLRRSSIKTPIIPSKGIKNLEKIKKQPQTDKNRK